VVIGDDSRQYTAAFAIQCTSDSSSVTPSKAQQQCCAAQSTSSVYPGPMHRPVILAPYRKSISPILFLAVMYALQLPAGPLMGGGDLVSSMLICRGSMACQVLEKTQTLMTMSTSADSPSPILPRLLPSWEGRVMSFLEVIAVHSLRFHVRQPCVA
jgi:hypothetical protein